MADNKVPESETTTIHLQNQVQVNGVKYPAGESVKVPKAQADDIARIDHEHTAYLVNLNKRNVYEVDAGTMGVGGS